MGRFVVKRTVDGEIMFNLLADNNEVIGTSETYRSMRSLRTGIDSVRRSAPSDIEDLTDSDSGTVKHPKWQLYLDRAGEYRFRLKAKNGEIILASEGYRSKSGALNGIDSVRRNSDSPIDDCRE